MTWENRVLRKFEEQPHFAQILSNEAITPTTIDYKRDSITFNHLPGEFPPFLRLDLRRRRVSVFYKNNWQNIDEEEIIEEFWILTIFDPRTILGTLDVIEELRIDKNRFIATGTYNVENLKLPSTVVQCFEEEEQLQRWVKLWIWHEELIRMNQMDIPPFPDIISQIFSRFLGFSHYWLNF